MNDRVKEEGLPADALPRRDASPVFVVSGPSGAGKSSLCAELLARFSWLRSAVSHTTRPARTGEREGKDYYFVSREVFERMIREGAFLEWAEVHGHLYGSSMENLRSVPENHSLLFEVDWKGATRIRKEIPEAVLVFVMTPSVEDLIQRIKRRGEISEQELSVRIRTATSEIRKAQAFDYLIVNDRFEVALQELQAIVVAESCRSRCRLPSRMERWTREIEAHQKAKGER